MSYFMSIDGLRNLEQEEKWEEARANLYHIWIGDMQNGDKLIRLLSECWYVLSLWDCSINTRSLSEQLFKDTLIECTQYGLLNLELYPKFLCVAGYMASMLPYLFYNDNIDALYSEWEQKGKEMLRKAARLDYNDKVAEVLSLGLEADLSEYAKSKEQLSYQLTDLFPNETAIETYFIDILTVK